MRLRIKNKPIVALRRYKYELIALCVNVVVALLALQFQTFQLFVASFTIFALSLVLIVYLKTRDRDYYYEPLDHAGSKKPWVGRGIFQYVSSENAFEITGSNAGFIMPRTIQWDDYQFDFDFKISASCLGWIVRATNLSSYVMLQCGLDGINPHIRINGAWIPKSHGDDDVNMTFENKLSLDKWYRGVVTTEKRSIKVAIYDGKTLVFDRHWTIPDMMTAELTQTDKKKLRYFQELDFDFGAIGFRSYGDEKAYVKKVYVEKL